MYSLITLVHQSYQEALSALKVKERFPDETRHLVSFSELGIYQYLDVLSEKRKHASYPNYSLMQLEAYDKEHHSNLVETLEQFIECDSNVNTAAKAEHSRQHAELQAETHQQNRRNRFKNINEKFTIYLEIKLRNMHL